MAFLTEKQGKQVIITSSIAIPVVVALMYILPSPDISGVNLTFLPLLNAILNGSTSVLLIAGAYAIFVGNKTIHQRIMVSALILSICFLLSYVTYHTFTDSTVYGGEGMLKYLYYFVLISHIILAIVVVPLVLITFVRALSDRFDKHRKIARITLPIWLYVTITGVIVYFMISPYYS